MSHGETTVDTAPATQAAGEAPVASPARHGPLTVAELAARIAKARAMVGSLRATNGGRFPEDADYLAIGMPSTMSRSDYRHRDRKRERRHARRTQRQAQEHAQAQAQAHAESRCQQRESEAAR